MTNNSYAVTPNDLRVGFEGIGIHKQTVIVHASLKSFGFVIGGAKSVVQALIESVGHKGTIMMPGFTYNTSDPTYWSRPGVPVPFTSDLPVDTQIGAVAEAFRLWPGVLRSSHPTLSFLAWGKDANVFLKDQTLESALRPVQKLYDADGSVLMIGTTLDSVTALHLAEVRFRMPYLLNGKAQVLRNGTIAWVETHSDPGCSDAFVKLEHYLDLSHVARVSIGKSVVRKINVRYLTHLMEEALKKDPKMFICDKSICHDCDVRRKTLITWRFQEKSTV